MNALAKYLKRKLSGVPKQSFYSGTAAEMYSAIASGEDPEIKLIVQVAERYARDAEIIELACGDGRVLKEVATSGFPNLTGLDSSAALLVKMRKKFNAIGIQAKSIHRDLTTWIPSSTYDLVLLTAGTIRLFDSEQRAKIFQNVKMALQDGGTFCVSTSEPVSDGQYLFWLGELKGNDELIPMLYSYEKRERLRSIGIFLENASSNRVVADYTSEVWDLKGSELQEELEAAGFRIQKISTAQVSTNVEDETLTFIEAML